MDREVDVNGVGPAPMRRITRTTCKVRDHAVQRCEDGDKGATEGSSLRLHRPMAMPAPRTAPEQGRWGSMCDATIPGAIGQVKWKNPPITEVRHHGW
jgi:hypothetical protein